MVGDVPIVFDALDAEGDPLQILIEYDAGGGFVPVTAAGEILFARIYRHGAVQTLLETPGGLIDEGESPMAAARRELLEETGCDCAEMQLIGSGSPDPARLSCKAYYFLATGCVETAVPSWDEHEEMELLKLIKCSMKT